MWDTAQDDQPGNARLSHDRPCPRCGHAMHVFLACGEGCACRPVAAARYAGV